MKKVIFTILILGLISLIPISFGQISIADPANQKSVVIMIDEKGNVDVQHIIRSSNVPKQLDLISGLVSNLTVIDEEGKDAQYAVIGDNQGIMIFPSKEDVIIEYDLEDALSIKEGIWTWDFLYLETTTFVFPENVDLIFTNSRPINLQDIHKISCHGCQMILEYAIDEPTTIYNINWEEQEFDVGLRSMAEVSSFNFDQPSKSISFDVNGNDKMITMMIPLKFLWNPYEVFSDEEKIRKNEFNNNGTHVWLSFRAETPGTINVIGTSVVSEFSILVPLVFGLAMMIPILARKKFSLH